MDSEDLYGIVFDFLSTWHALSPGLPELLDADGEIQIFRGYQNGMPSPSGTDYIIFTQLYEEPIDWNIEDFQTNAETLDDGTITIAPLRKHYFQVDSYGEYAMQRLTRIRNVFNSDKGSEFFRNYRDKYGGIGVVKNRNATTRTEPDGTNRYAACYTTELVVTARLSTIVPQDWLNRLSIQIKGVKPNGN